MNKFKVVGNFIAQYRHFIKFSSANIVFSAKKKYNILTLTL